MNEEDILKECNELAEDKHHELGDCWNEEYSANAIKGLLDLYKHAKQELKQEKEKNKKLEEGIREVRNKLEVADYYGTRETADDLTRLLGEEVEE